ncbi:MAG TPA: methylenetetrahydrofolate--tRNA-(uracil(54)-C(5))-methyltransferase (FADH(2)-oxidizing) TrmFO, partial [Candidatus Avimonas sp.]|nr:methylenetetrahydrofolate--tRNA-(uracil(54)-C(5))-methyltransferase (FADH(2)-oxidizing) TrmFO [Candidatus Avimonas sp.]
QEKFGKSLSFYDAAAPIVAADSVDMNFAFKASRYGKGGDEGDYINCPLNKQEYEEFHAALVSAETAPLHSFDNSGDIKVYEGCMPIEVLAKRGLDAIRFGPMKPVGLTDPRTGHRPWAVLQLRKENLEGTMLNMVGFQTNLKFGEQKRVFSMIPALHSAEFLRYGVMHRNTFIDSPRLLDAGFNLRTSPKTFFAGQITGVEGYMESAASGIIAGINAARAAAGKPMVVLPKDTMIGALAGYISDPNVRDFQPMGANFGLLPPLEEHIKDKQLRYAAYANRALKSLEESVLSRLER